MIVDVDGGRGGGGEESAQQHQTSSTTTTPPSGVSGTGVAVAGILVAGAYMAQRGFALGDLEFFVLAAYLALILIFLMSVRNEASNNITTNREAFDEGLQSEDGCTLDAEGNLKNDKDDGCLYVLYSMPRRVVEKIGPGIDKIGAVFRGQDPSGGESPEYVRLHEGNVYLTDAEKKGDDPAGKLRQVVTEYKRMDHALCLLKHARPEEYGRILRELTRSGNRLD